MLDLDQLLRYAVEQRASDVHLKAGSRPYLRVDGQLQESPFEVIEPDDTQRVALAVMPPARAEEFRNQHEADFVYGVPGLGRFRVSAFRQRGFVGLVLRRVVPGASRASTRSGSRSASDASRTSSRGLVLVTGLAGSGKTTTLAAMIDHVNETQREPHRHHRGPDRGAPPRQAVDRQRSARSGPTPSTTRPRCATCCARTPT